MEIGVDISSKLEINSIYDRPLTKGRTLYFFLKRGLDLILTVPGFFVLIPLMVVIAVLIHFDSPGSIFFVQKRVGVRKFIRGGQTYLRLVLFPIYKFRTMVSNSDPALHQEYIKALIHNDQDSLNALQGGVVQTRKLVSDPRVTRIGKILRKTSMDELPQLWNVLIGDMSLVGPRPAIPYEVEEYSPWHMRRLETIPGMTGLWQVTARSSCDFDTMVMLDIEYIGKQSLWMDIKILLKTPFVVISAKGAT